MKKIYAETYEQGIAQEWQNICDLEDMMDYLQEQHPDWDDVEVYEAACRRLNIDGDE